MDPLPQTAPKRKRQTSPSGWIAFLAHFLFILVAWTLFIKYLFPIGYSVAMGEPWSQYIYWDLWPVIHLWLGWALLARPNYTYPLALVVSVLEIVIIVSFFARFLADPEWSIWRTNWFVNKVFVLACFVLLLGTAVWRPGAIKGNSQTAGIT